MRTVLVILAVLVGLTVTAWAMIPEYYYPSGIILMSPDSSCATLTIDDADNPVVTPTACP